MTHRHSALRARDVCKTKTHFRTRADAEDARKRLLAREEVVVGVYGCVICGGFHFTHHLGGRKVDIRTHRDVVPHKRGRT